MVLTFQSTIHSMISWEYFNHDFNLRDILKLHTYNITITIPFKRNTVAYTFSSESETFQDTA